MKKQLPIPVGPGRGSLAQGYQPTIQQLADQLGVETHSLKSRVMAGDIEGEPAAYSGTRVFAPDYRTKFNVDFLHNNASSVACNYVLRDGQSYDVPILVPGPGVFVATGLCVEIAQRLYDPAVGEMWVNYHSNMALPERDTAKFSLWPFYGYDPSGYSVPLPGGPWMNFFWNLLDARTGDLYSDEPLNHLMLKPRALSLSASQLVMGSAPYMDGGIFSFATPWVFPFGTTAVFKFQPINPVLQLDSSVAPNPGADISIYYEDRENGVRNQSVKVKAVLMGYRMMVTPGA